MGPYVAPDLLVRFIGSKSLTQAAAAKQLNIVPAALNGYLSRKQRPRADIRQRIAKWSGGEVPESSWLTAKERKGLAKTDPVVIAEPEKTAREDDSTDSHKSLG